MLNALLVFRFCKYLGLMMLAGATVGAVVPQQPELRQRMVYGLGTVGLATTWLAGFGLLRQVGWPLSTPWIAGSVVLSVVWFALVVRAVEPGASRRPLGWGAAAALAAALALMVFRPA